MTRESLEDVYKVIDRIFLGFLRSSAWSFGASYPKDVPSLGKVAYGRLKAKRNLIKNPLKSA